MTPDLLPLASLLAPSGPLRAVINLGNPILAGTDAQGQARGVSVDLATALARRLGRPLLLVEVDAAAKSVAAVQAGNADVGFFAVDPQRAQQIAFTDPYLLIEGCYLVRETSPLKTNEEVDAVGHTVVVGKGSAYDLHLSRTLAHAHIARAPTSPAVVDTFLNLGNAVHVAAGVRQQLQADADRLGRLRLLDGRFMVIKQAMGLRADRGPTAAEALRGFVEEAKANGFIAAALQRHAIQGATVAPPADL